MAEEEDRSFAPTRAQANRAPTQGLGVGQKEMNLQRDPNRYPTATDPERTEPFDTELEEPAGEDRAGPADFGDVADQSGAASEKATGIDPNLGRGEADAGDAEGDLGAGTPPNVDIHKLGQEDNPEEDWGDPAGGAMHSTNHTRRGVKTEAERGQGNKTRQRTKDIFSRRT